MIDSRKNSHDFSVYFDDDSDINVTIEAEMLCCDSKTASGVCLNTLDMTAVMNKLGDVVTIFIKNNKIIDRAGEEQDG